MNNVVGIVEGTDRGGVVVRYAGGNMLWPDYLTWAFGGLTNADGTRAATGSYNTTACSFWWGHLPPKSQFLHVSFGNYGAQDRGVLFRVGTRGVQTCRLVDYSGSGLGGLLRW